jgi:putative flippase GtrA
VLVLVTRSPQPHARTSGRVVKTWFLIVGVWNTLFGLAIFSLANVTLGRERYAVSLTLMFLIAVPHAHLAQRRLVWRSRAPYLPELIRFSWVFVITYVANLVLLTVAVVMLDAPTLSSQAVISVVIAIATFLIHRSWTFRHTPVAVEPGAHGSVSDPVLWPYGSR